MRTFIIVCLGQAVSMIDSGMTRFAFTIWVSGYGISRFRPAINCRPLNLFFQGGCANDLAYFLNPLIQTLSTRPRRSLLGRRSTRTRSPWRYRQSLMEETPSERLPHQAYRIHTEFSHLTPEFCYKTISEKNNFPRLPYFW